MSLLCGFRPRWIGVAAFLVLGLVLTLFITRWAATAQDEAILTNKMKIVCVGRFLIDLPANAEVKVRAGFIGGFDIGTRTDETDDEFDARLHELESQVTASDEETGPMRLETARAFAADGMHGKVVVYNRQGGQTMEGQRIVDTEDVSVTGIARINGTSITAYSEHRPLDVGPRLERTLKRIRPLALNELPSEKGFCINGAIVRDPFEHKGNESVTLFAGLPGHPDVNIVLSSMAGTNPAPGLLERHARTDVSELLVMWLAFTHLRELPRTINGLTGDELVMRVRESNFTTGYSFQWEMAGQKHDLYAPLLMLELESGANPVPGGKPGPSSLTEKQMFQLWDRIAGSIRVRPTTPTSS